MVARLLRSRIQKCVQNKSIKLGRHLPVRLLRQWHDSGQNNTGIPSRNIHRDLSSNIPSQWPILTNHKLIMVNTATFPQCFEKQTVPRKLFVDSICDRRHVTYNGYTQSNRSEGGVLRNAWRHTSATAKYSWLVLYCWLQHDFNCTSNSNGSVACFNFRTLGENVVLIKLIKSYLFNRMSTMYSIPSKHDATYQAYWLLTICCANQVFFIY